MSMGEVFLFLVSGVRFHGNILTLLLTHSDPRGNSGTLTQFPVFLFHCPVDSQ